MTPAQTNEITACTRLIAVGYTAQAIRDLGYAEAAIRAALSAETTQGHTPYEP